ncbi:MAG: DNA mismatch repair protein MutL, partial [Proteobacteria bacterium]|nr:DNA mismatch repair protein MutL [Pseudomonadota bacterium]
RLPADQDLATRLRTFWPPSACEGLGPFDFERLGYRAHGVAGSPAMAQSRGDRILLYVNGRPVQDKLMLGAVRQAYKGMLLSREYPQAVLFLELPRDEVDVNVHPAKLEVRFIEESRVFSTIRGGIVQALAVLTDQGRGYLGPDSGPDSDQRDRRDVSGAYRQDDRPDYGHRSPSGPVGHDAPSFRENGQKFPSYREYAAFASRPVPMDLGPGRGGLAGADPDHAPGYSSEPDPGLDPARFNVTDAARPAPLAGTDYVYLGQVADTYLVLRRGQSLVLVDQHAAHERVLLAAMRRERTRGDSQPLALPLEMDLHPSEAETLDGLRDGLRAMGFILETREAGESGASAAHRLLVRGIPPTLDTGRAREYLADALAARARTLDDLWTMMSCKTAIKAGQPLAVDEALALLDVWLRTPEREYCPHGRPVVVSWNPQELEKLFKRK